MMKGVSAAALAVSLGLTALPAWAEQAPVVCPEGSLFGLVDPVASVPAACPLAPGSFLAQSQYVQNASRVGGTALATYPLLRLSAGITGRAGLIFDAPSEVAQSGVAGGGIFSATSPGFGVSYALTETTRSALALAAEERPPASFFATSKKQAPYAVDATSLYRLSSALSLDATVSDAVARYRGLERLAPKMDVGLGYDVAPGTQVTTDVGTGITERRQHAQSFGDVSIRHVIRKNLGVDTGLGTAFNPVSSAKAHYLCAGLDLKN